MNEDTLRRNDTPDSVPSGVLTVYFNCGEGYSEAYKETITFRKNGTPLAFSVALPENIRSVRVDPLDNSGSLVAEFSAHVGDLALSYDGNYLYRDFGNNTMLFQTLDPQIEIKIPAGSERLNVSLTVCPVHENCLQSICRFINSLEDDGKRMLSQVERLEESMGKQSEVIQQLAGELENANAHYAEIQACFFWRLTSLPRRLCQRLKNLLSRTRHLRFLYSGLRSVLLYGVRTTRDRYREYRESAKAQLAHAVEYEISPERAEEERNYAFPRQLKISVLVPLYNTPKQFLKEMIDSVRNQTYQNWELCLADGSDSKHGEVGAFCRELAREDDRIRYRRLNKNMGISGNTNACIDLATGDYIALFDHDDVLHPSALFECMKAICEKGADFVYTDEATFSTSLDKLSVCHYKPDFAPDTLRSNNYICHLSVFSHALLDQAGRFNSECDGSQDYDLILRLTERAKTIVHIQKILYFWRAHANSTALSLANKPYVFEAAHRGLKAHLKRLGLKGTVLDAPHLPSVYRMKYALTGFPLVSILIPNKDHIDELKTCIESIYQKSTYRNFEVIVIENNSEDPETFAYYETLKEMPQLRIVRWEGAFNYAAINNFGAKYAEGEYLLLLNNDTEVITRGWIEELLMFAQRSDVGAAGARLYFPDGSIQHAGIVLGLGHDGIAGHTHYMLPRRDYGYMGRAAFIQNTSACTGACLMIRRNVFEEVGGFDENFRVAYNDVDLCMKIRRAGYLIVYNPYAELYHYESKSRGYDESEEEKDRFRAEVALFRKKWAAELEAGDPYYNPNFRLDSAYFEFK